ncbi:hypothetical protein Peur_008089 [Populus x canadensis]
MRRELMGTRQWHKPVDFDFNGNLNIFSESPTLFPSKYMLKVSNLKAFQLLRTLFYTPKRSQQPIDDIFEWSWSKQSPCNGPPCTLMRTRGKIEDAQKSRLKQSKKEGIDKS